MAGRQNRVEPIGVKPQRGPLWFQLYVHLGPSAVLIGRPFVFGLANAGALGVAHGLRLKPDELEIAMALCGCATLAKATPALLFKPDRWCPA